MELEDLLSDELLEWLGNDEPDVSDDTDIEQLLAAASDVSNPGGTSVEST